VNRAARPVSPSRQNRDREEIAMKKRLVVSVLLLVLLALVPAAPAAAVNWGIGADLGYNVFMPSSDYGSDIENINSFGWPSGSAVLGELPGFGGLRLSFAGAKPTHEVWIGTELGFVSYSGSSMHTLGLNANYQYNFSTGSGVTPYVTAGVGINQLGYSGGGHSQSAMATIFGGGVGIAHWMGNGCGRLRAEVRYDQQTEGEADGDTVIPKGANLGIRFGFDLWDKK
jgi:hypothetical protein